MKKYHKSDSLYLVMPFLAPHFMELAHRFLGLTHFQALGLTVAAIVLFLIIPARRIWRELAADKRALERRFAEEDERLFGQSLTSPLHPTP